MTVKSVAVILERELASTIKEWLKQVKLVPDLTIIPLLLDVIIIADEADRQLTETVRSFMTAQQAAVA